MQTMKKIVADIAAEVENIDNDQIFEGKSAEENAGYIIGAGTRSYPTDYTLRGIYEKWKRGDVRIPSFQRNYVWKRARASLLIDSFLSGLPVPPVFFFEDENLISNVIDGHQRIRTIIGFIDGTFPEVARMEMHTEKENNANKEATKRKFALKLDDKNIFNNLTYDQFSGPQRRKFDNAVLRAVNIFQNEPAKENAGQEVFAREKAVHAIFERLNTGGIRLTPQEIRNCVWQGGFIETLVMLNNYDSWREILAKKKPHDRLRDVELILRIFAFRGEGRKSYKPSLLKFLDAATLENRSGKTLEVKNFVSDFKTCADVICEKFDPLPCSFPKAVNEQVLDAVFCVVLDNLDNLPSDIGKRYRKVKEEFKNNIIAVGNTASAFAVNTRYDWLKNELLK